MLRKFSKLSFAIFLLALILRLYGIKHGFPFIFHVDEPALVRSAVGIRFNPNPHHFDWPHLHFYLNFLVYGLLYLVRGFFQVVGLRPFLEGFVPIFWRDPLIFYLTSRILNAVIGSLSVLILYQTGKKLFSEQVGLLSALALALFPYHVWSSHFALIDVPMVFWSMLSFYFSTLIFKEGKLKWYALAGIFAGFSASTKYNGGYSVFFILLAHFLYLREAGIKNLFSKIKFLAISAVSSIIAFFVGTPYALFDYQTFLIKDGPKGALWQFVNVGKIDGIADFFGQLFLVLTTKFDSDFGYSFLVIFELYILYFIFTRKTREKTLIFALGILYFFYITTFDKTRVHYYMLTFPFVCLMVGHLVSVFTASNSKFMTKMGVYLVLALTFIPPLVTTVQGNLILARPDTRNLASDWLDNNVGSDEEVLHYGRDLEPIMVDRDFAVQKKSDLASFAKTPSANYLVLATNEPLEKIEHYEDAKSKLILIQEYKSKGRMGPDIYIFSINLEGGE